MSKKKITKTFIQIVLDRSGSMGSCRANTIEGFNEFVTKQRAEEGKAALSLVQFDDQYEPNYVHPLNKVPILDFNTFVPRGFTALNDAIAKTILLLEQQENIDTYDQVLFIIMTDGGENASVEYPGVGNELLNALIQRKHLDKWQFAYMGANQDAHAVATAMGGQVFASSAYNYVSTEKGATSSFANLSSGVSAYRGSGKSQTGDLFENVRKYEGTEESEDVSGTS